MQKLHGERRNFDNVDFKDQSCNVVSRVEQEVDLLEPLAVFRQDGVAEAKSAPELEGERKQLTEVPRTEAIWRRGQWLASPTRLSRARTSRRSIPRC